MKKFILVFLLTSSLHAQRLFESTLLLNNTLSGATTSATSDSVYIGRYDKVSFAVKYDETEVGGVSGVLTFEVSDGNVWYDYDILMQTGGEDAPVANVSFTADDEYFIYLPHGVTAHWLRCKLTGTGVDADDTIAIIVRMFGQQL